MPLLRTRMSDIATPLTALSDTDAMAVDADQGASVFLYRKMTGAKYKELVQALDYDSKLLSNASLTVTANTPTNGMTIALKQKDASTNAGSTSDQKILISFRSSTLTSGLRIVRSVTGALSLVISSGSTLGFANNVAGFVYVYALDNAGTVKLAVSGTDCWDEGVLQTTVAEGGAGAADSGTVLYSDAVYTNVAIRFLGVIDITEITAGTWTAGPTKISMYPCSRNMTPIISTNNASLAGSVSTDLVNSNFNLILPVAGVWDIEGWATVTTTTAADAFQISVWDATNSADLGNRSPAASISATSIQVGLVTRVRVRCGAITVRVKMYRNGASVPNFAAGNTLSAIHGLKALLVHS